MSICLSVCLSVCAIGCIFSEASYWPWDHMIHSRPLICPLPPTIFLNSPIFFSSFFNKQKKLDPPQFFLFSISKKKFDRKKIFDTPYKKIFGLPHKFFFDRIKKVNLRQNKMFDPHQFLMQNKVCFMAMVILSTLVKKFRVFRMRDFKNHILAGLRKRA